MLAKIINHFFSIVSRHKMRCLSPWANSYLPKIFKLAVHGDFGRTVWAPTKVLSLARTQLAVLVWAWKLLVVLAGTEFTKSMVRRKLFSSFSGCLPNCAHHSSSFLIHNDVQHTLLCYTSCSSFGRMAFPEWLIKYSWKQDLDPLSSLPTCYFFKATQRIAKLVQITSKNQVNFIFDYSLWLVELSNRGV
jgi:hypothetical protein